MKNLIVSNLVALLPRNLAVPTNTLGVVSPTGYSTTTRGSFSFLSGIIWFTFNKIKKLLPVRTDFPIANPYGRTYTHLQWTQH